MRALHRVLSRARPRNCGAVFAFAAAPRKSSVSVFGIYLPVFFLFMQRPFSTLSVPFPHRPLSPPSKATITFLKSGEYPASDQTTVVAPPPLSDDEREAAKQRRQAVRRLRLVAVATGIIAVVAGVVVKRGAGGGGGSRP